MRSERGEDYALEDVELPKAPKGDKGPFWNAHGMEAARFILNVMDDDERVHALRQRLQQGKHDGLVSRDVGIPRATGAPGVAAYVCAVCGVFGGASTSHKTYHAHKILEKQHRDQARTRKAAQKLRKHPEYSTKAYMVPLLTRGTVPSEFSSMLRNSTEQRSSSSAASPAEAVAAAPAEAAAAAAAPAAAAASEHSSDLSDSDSEADRSLPGTLARAAPGTSSPAAPPKRACVSRLLQDYGVMSHALSILGHEADVHDEMEDTYPTPIETQARNHGGIRSVHAQRLLDQANATVVNSAVFATVPRSAAGDDDMRTHASSPKKQSDFE